MGPGVGEIRQKMIDVHDGHTYYADAEDHEWLRPFWGTTSPFREAFLKLDLTDTLELACGRGRHSAQVIESIGRLTLVDVNESNLEACKKRFAGKMDVRYILNDGCSLQDVPSESLSSVWSFDAMVHFEATDVIRYIEEVARVLRQGGRALLHYSNNDSPGVNPFEDASWRNYFSQSMMHHFALRNGLSILSSVTIPWGGRDALDGLILLERTG